LRGSIQDIVLQEMVQRERFEEYQKHLYLGRVLMSLFGNETTNTQQIARAEELLELAIFQTAYDPREIRKQMEIVNAAAQAEREKRLRDARLLAKVASYDASNDDSTDAFRNVLNKRDK
jgi:hypothetical protein